MTLMYTMSESDHAQLLTQAVMHTAWVCSTNCLKLGACFFSDYDGESAAGDTDYRTYILGLDMTSNP